MITTEEFRRLKSRVEEMRAEGDRAAGALAELLRRLRKETGCRTFKEARSLLKKVRADLAAAERKFRAAAAAFEESSRATG